MTAFDISTAKASEQVSTSKRSPWDLREWLDHVEKLGELKRIKGADRDIDLGPLSQSVEQLPDGGPALLFEDISGFPNNFRILTNANNSLSRFGFTCGTEDCRSVKDAIQHWRAILSRLARMPVDEVRSGPIFDNVVEGTNIDLDLFPTPRWHSHDGGRYIGTGGVVITRDPDLGDLNFGTYRMMVAGKNRLTGLIAHGKHGDIHRRKYFDRKVSCPVVVSCGHHPLYLVAGASSVREDLSEFDVLGSIAGSPVEVVVGKHTGLPIPANSEIAIEGEFLPSETASEGPFGEWTGYYASPPKPQPVMHVKAIYYRNNPIILGSPPSKPSPSNLQTRILRSIAIEDHLRSTGVPGVTGAWLHLPGGSRYFFAISIKQQYVGHARQVAMSVLGMRHSNYAGRFVVVVDDDIDVTDINDVLWAVCTRCDPKIGMSIIDGFWSSALDPAVPIDSGRTASRVVIDACWPFDRLSTVPKTCFIRPEQKDDMLKKWGFIGASIQAK